MLCLAFFLALQICGMWHTLLGPWACPPPWTRNRVCSCLRVQPQPYWPAAVVSIGDPEVAEGWRVSLANAAQRQQEGRTRLLAPRHCPAF